MAKLISERQEQIFRLVHQDFEGLSQAQAAAQLGITQAAVSDALARVKKVMPYFFPILTKTEAERYHLYMNEGWSVVDIAEHCEVTPRAIQLTLQRVKAKGMFFTEAKGRILSYEPSMDDKIKHKF